MSGWGQTPARMPNTPKDDGPLRECWRCDLAKPTAGGVELAPGRWACGDCWKLRQLLRQRANRG